MSAPLPAIGAGKGLSKEGRLWLPPWIYPPAEAEPFDWQGSVGLPAAAATAVVLSFLVPRGRNGIIRAYANQVAGGLFTDGSGAVVFAITHDNQPYRYYNNILFSLGNINNPTYHPFGLRVFDGQTIQFTVKNVGLVPAAITVNARMMGWYYPKDKEDPNLWMVQ
jgi:hypothetical protein